MAPNQQNDSSTVHNNGTTPTSGSGSPVKSRRFRFGIQPRTSNIDSTLSSSSNSTMEQKGQPTQRRTLGILADKETDEVPGTVILLSHSVRNAPLGEDKIEHHGDDTASIMSRKRSRVADQDSAKRTSDGKIVLNPQPEDTPNDPLNWPAWRRDIALLCLGFYCMLGGGMTPVLAAGFTQVARTFDVSFSQVALTTGLYMMGLGVGSVLWSPTAYLYGKRTVYLASSILFVVSAVWCALAPNYANLVVARVFQGIAVSPVECLPSATIAEIFFLHERAFRIGIYTLLLLGGKNLIPLVSAAIIQAKGWRWVFWIVAIVVGFGGVLLFFFVPETFWDRTPRPRKLIRGNGSHLSLHSRFSRTVLRKVSRPSLDRQRSQSAVQPPHIESSDNTLAVRTENLSPRRQNLSPAGQFANFRSPRSVVTVHFAADDDASQRRKSAETEGYFTPRETCNIEDTAATHPEDEHEPTPLSMPGTPMHPTKSMVPTEPDVPHSAIDPKLVRYTTGLRNSPPVPYLQTLRPWSGRVSEANWLKVCIRPFILFAYPAVLWSSMVYALSVGWLIVLSEAIAHIYETQDSYNFTSLQVGLVYLSPFIGGVLGTAVAGRFSDVIVRFMARRNGGIYEPEFRLVMAIPIAICTGIGLMGFGWSAQEKDNFMVPTVFFGIISFGCCIGSTTAITFCVDSYRQFAAEALVTLNFSKNILHGLIWSLFFPHWLQASGPKLVFLAIGGIQVACLLLTIPMYIYGKRARMWTVRMKMMERF